MKLKQKILIIILLIIPAVFLVKKNYTKTFFEKPITIVANNESMGDSVNPATMDYFDKVQYPQMSLLVEYLKKHNIPFEVVDWEDPNIKWEQKNKIVIGPIWGYTKKVNAFLAWLNSLETKNIQLVNDAKFLKWNVKKNYLIDLENGDIKIPETIVFAPDSKLSFQESLDEFYKKFNHTDVVIKGVVDAAGFGYYHAKPENMKSAEKWFETLKLNNNGVVMQSFLPEIAEKGELSFVFFGGKLSHYFLKVPKYGEERVQIFYGGKSFHFTQSSAASQLKEIKNSFRSDLKSELKELEKAPEIAETTYRKLSNLLQSKNIPEPAFVRIDGVIIDDELTVMEIEGIEPYLEIQETIHSGKSSDIISHYAHSILDANQSQISQSKVEVK